MYGWDVVGAAWRGEITVRKLRVLVEHLPPGGATWRAVHGHGWTEVEHLLADVFDAVAQATTAVYRSIPTKDNRRIPDPTPHPRPGVEQQRPGDGPRAGDRGHHSPEQVVDYLMSVMPPQPGP